MKKRLVLLLLIFCLLIGFPIIVCAQTVTQFPNYISTDRIYDYDPTTGWLGAYYMSLPALTGNDEIVGRTTTQTLTNKSLTSPAITGGSLSGATYAGITGAITSKVLEITDWILSAADRLTTLLICTSGSSGTNYIIDSGGTAGRILIIRNGTAQSIVIKENGQTGVTIATGKTAVVMHSGTDYVRVSADATH